MMQLVESILGWLYIAGLFYCLPFLLAVVLPAWGIPSLVQRIINKKRETLPSLISFILCLVCLAFLANILWEVALFNRVYYEWDRIFLPYTFFWHESPLLDGSGTWIAAGWKKWHLEVIWIVLTLAIYVASGVFAYWINRHAQHAKMYRKTLTISILILTIITLIIPQLISKGFEYYWRATFNQNYKEVNTACTSSNTQGPQIFYAGDQSEWVSDLEGGNLRQAFKKHLQLRGSRGALSPDGTMAAMTWGEDIWIHCLNSDGAFKIPLPEFEKKTGFYEPRSVPSWSPDSTQMIMNNNGNLTLIDIALKTSSILKQNVALIDNNIDITAKNRDTTIPPFEFGDAYWSPKGLIYYTGFKNHTVTLHSFDLKTNSDEIILQRDNKLTINSGDPTGKWLHIYDSPWESNTDGSRNDVEYFLNTETNQVVEFDKALMYPEIIWSPSGTFYAQSTGSWENSPTLQGIPSIVTDIDSKQSINVTDIVKSILTQKNIETAKKALVVEVNDFIDDSKVLIVITMHSSEMDEAPRQINGILDLSEGELVILQDYPAGSFQSTIFEERIYPMKVIR